MKSFQYSLVGLLSAATIFTACGDDVTKVTKIEGTSGLETVASADSLGKCTEEILGEMKFSSKENAIFVCADSAWKNISETKKSGCSAEALSDSSGFKIVCDGDSIGVVKNGASGENGKDGVNGDAGEGCEITDNGDGTVSVVCGESSTTLYKAFCDGMLYDPDSSFCLDDVVIENSTLSKKKAIWDLMNPEIEYDTFVDKRDGQVYRSVKIGEQTWMAENLNYRGEGTDTLGVCYDYDESKCDLYGRLYGWFEAMDLEAQHNTAGGKFEGTIPENARGICPEGFRVPTAAEYGRLRVYLNSLGYRARDLIAGVSNTSGFGVLLGGYYDVRIGNFNCLEERAYLWAYDPEAIGSGRIVEINADTNTTYIDDSFVTNVYNSFAFVKYQENLRCIRTQKN